MSRSTPAPLEGAKILAEVPGEAGVLLWKTLRTVRLWAAGASEERTAELSAAGGREQREREITAAGAAEALARPLKALAALLDPAASLGRERVSAACAEVAGWARASGEVATALAFSEAAALAGPGDPDLALWVVRDALAKGETARADHWCQLARELARDAADWDSHVRAFLLLVGMARRRGNFPVARRLADRAIRLAKRHGLDELRGSALHEHLAMAMDSGDVRAARRYADGAFRAYGACHPHNRVLSNDLYCLWLSQGQFERALRPLRAILPVFPERERLMVASNVVFAAGGIGDRKEFGRAWSVAAPMLEWRQVRGSFANSLLSMARGASGVGEWELARTMAERGRAVAEEQEEWEVVFDAEWTLGRVRERRSALHPLAR